jgi:hypothetical protein
MPLSASSRNRTWLRASYPALLWFCIALTGNAHASLAAGPSSGAGTGKGSGQGGAGANGNQANQPPAIPLGTTLILGCVLDQQWRDSKNDCNGSCNDAIFPPKDWSVADNLQLSAQYNSGQWNVLQDKLKRFIAHLTCSKLDKTLPFSVVFLNEAAEVPTLARVLVQSNPPTEQFGNRVAGFKMNDLQLVASQALIITTHYSVTAAPNPLLSQVSGVLSQASGAFSKAAGAGGAKAAAPPAQQPRAFIVHSVELPEAFRALDSSVVPQVAVTDMFSSAPTEIANYMLTSLSARVKQADVGAAADALSTINIDLNAAFVDQCLGKTPGTIAGSVVQGNGWPAAGAQIAIVGDLGEKTTANSLGSFTLTEPPGTYQLQVSAPGFATTLTKPLALEAGGKVDAPIELASIAGPSVYGVVQAEGTAIAGATVALTDSTTQATTDARGHFHLSQGAGIYQITVSAPGYATTTTVPLVMAAGTNLWIDAINIARPPGPTNIQGTVIQATSGAPLVGAAVKIVEPQDALPTTATTNLAGQFALTVAGPGQYRIGVSAAGFQPLTQEVAVATVGSKVLPNPLQLAPAAAAPDQAACSRALGDALGKDLGLLRLSTVLPENQAKAFELVETLFATYVALANPSQSAGPAPATQYTMGKLTRFAFSLGAAAIWKTQLNTPAKLGTGTQPKLLRDNPSTALTFVAVDIAFRRYDETRYSPSREERARWFLGIALTPNPGAVAGLAFEVVRGLSVEAGYALLIANTLASGETLKPNSPALHNPTPRQKLGAIFAGISYNFQ